MTFSPRQLRGPEGPLHIVSAFDRATPGSEHAALELAERLLEPEANEEI